MTKRKKELVVKQVAKSTYEICVDDTSTIVETSQEAERKFRNACGRETINTYLYRHDWDEDGQLIESYMIG